MTTSTPGPSPQALRPLRGGFATGTPARATRSGCSAALIGRRQAKANLRAEEVLHLYVEKGMSLPQIADKVGLSRQRVHQILARELAEAAERVDRLATYALDRELLLIESLIREAVLILTANCDACRCDTTKRSTCTTCNKTGFLYPPDARLEAIDRIRGASNSRIKLLHLDKLEPPVPHPARPYYEMLQTLSDDELAEEVERLEAALAGEPIPE